MKRGKKMSELTFKNVKEGNFELAYKIPEEVGRRYESLISFNRGRDFNEEVVTYVGSFVKEFQSYLTDENEQEMNKRLVRYNKLVVELKTSIMNAVKIPSIMISGGSNYPSEKKRKEVERVHNLEGELYSDYGKHAKFMENTEKMFNPVLIQRREDAIKKKAEQGFQDTYVEIDHEEIVAYGIDLEGNRVYLETDGKPSDETRALLKKAAMRWSPKNVRWQRVLTDNAIRSIKREVFSKLNIEIEV